jgi:hypothetical protein
MTEESGFDSPQGQRLFSYPLRPDRLWGLNGLLYIGYWGLFSRGLSDKDVKLIAHFHLVPLSRMVELYLHFSTCLIFMA